MTGILVTGGNGFIGQHLVSELVARGRHVRVIDVRVPCHALPSVDYIEGSVLDEKLLQRAMAGIEEVYHLAGLPGMWRPDSTDFHVVNFTGTKNVLEAARRCGVAKFMHCSTESILFGASQPDGIAAEDVSLTVDKMPGPYTRSKMLADSLVLETAAQGFPVIVGCPTMPIGPHDYNPTPPTAMLRHFLDSGRFQLYLDFTLNLVDVRDVAVGLILAMEKGRIGHRYLLGGDSIPLKQVLALMAAITGHRKLVIPVPGRLAELSAWIIELKANYVTHRVPSATVEGVRIARRATALSIEKARRELGYAPRPVQPVLQETISQMIGTPVGAILKHAA
jgi:dihydroflavonol-4-reductase